MPDLKKAACIILLVAIPLSTSARQNEKPAADQPAKQTVEKKQPLDPSQQKVLSVLDQLLETRKGFADDSLRIMIQAQVADLLWTYDEARARRLFEEAFQAIESAKLPEQSLAMLADSRYLVRSTVSRLAGQHDAALAAKLAESVTDQPPYIDPKLANSGYHRSSERTMLQEQLVVSFARQDPKLAVQTALPLLEKGNIEMLVFLLSIIKFKDAKAANEFFIQILAKAKLRELSFNDIRALASYLFHNFGQGIFRFSSAAGSSNPYAHIQIEQAVIEQFLDLAYTVVIGRLDRAMTNKEGARLDARSSYDYTLPKLLAPYIDRYLPDKSAAFRARVEESLRRVPPDEQPYLVMSEPGTVQELVTRADALADAKAKDSLYDRAVTQAILAGDFDQASAIVNKISDELNRANVQQNLRIRMDQKRDADAWKALEKGDFDKVEAIIAEISDLRPRYVLLNSLIGQLITYKDKARVVRLLDEARQQAASVENGIERVQQLMALANTVSMIDENRAFEEVEVAIKEFNRAGFAPELDRYQEIETKGKQVVKINTGLNVLLNMREFQWFGSKDFDRTLLLAQQFQMKEAAAIVQLAACRGVLEKYQSTLHRKPQQTK